MGPSRNLCMRRHAFFPVAAGLLITQGLATFFVRLSNSRLIQRVEAIEHAGWLALPAGPAAETLGQWRAALGGALFFTLSIGIGLTLATWSILYLWQRLFASRPRLLWIPAAVWLALAIAVNVRGWALFPTLLVVCTPLATALAALCTGAAPEPGAAGRLWPVPLLTLVLLTGLWATQLDARLFVTIRDQILLSNAFGRSVNDFYYRYTLHAAECFKSFSQKTVRTAVLHSLPDDEAARRLTRVLAHQDVVVIGGATAPDMTVSLTGGDKITLAAPGGKRLEAARSAFLADPRPWLARYARAADRFGPFRRLTFVGLLLGFPILLYMMVDGCIGRIAGLFTRGAASIWIRSGVCMFIGLLLLAPMLGAHTEPPSPGEVGAALTAAHWHQRVAALRYIEKERLDLTRYPHFKTLLASPLVVERYWVARALAYSHAAAAYEDLLALIQDPHPNVVCQAYYALGERRDRRAVSAIRERMLQSDHWYTQWYAYRAMRRLGWNQDPSTSAP